MRIFTCSACQHAVFFDNVTCTACGAALGFLPDIGEVSALEPSDESLRALHPKAEGRLYRKCQNAIDHGVCTWLVPESDNNPLCRACRLNETIPDLSKPDSQVAWAKLEQAKRRLMYSLLDLGLPVESRKERPEGGLGFAFMQDQANLKVFTGQSEGLITINIAEADEPFREKIRKQLGETYRTLLGHFRHEIGHYYWERLIKDDNDLLADFRKLFGDETTDYEAALKLHYANGAPADWPTRFVSTYASTHPWEDFAESWAHYLHVVDTLDTARHYGVVVRKTAVDGGPPTLDVHDLHFSSFDELIAAWFPLTVALNSLNRSMGLPDTYPFVLSELVVKKLRLVHDVIAHSKDKPKAREPMPLAPAPQQAARA